MLACAQNGTRRRRVNETARHVGRRIELRSAQLRAIDNRLGRGPGNNRQLLIRDDIGSRRVGRKRRVRNRCCQLSGARRSRECRHFDRQGYGIAGADSQLRIARARERRCRAGPAARGVRYACHCQ